MECPKCHRNISEEETVCPHCHKVLALECPNCHCLSKSPVCEKCGYLILVKCAKCGKLVPAANDKCRCGFNTAASTAIQECETDEYASVIIKFEALKNIRRVLGSQELFSKFYFRLKNLLTAQLKAVDGRIITYNDIVEINMCKELSFVTSANKATRLALKIANAFAGLNAKIIEELSTPLKLNITVVKKKSEDLLKKTELTANVKLLEVKKDEKKYLKGMQIILDQFVRDTVNKDYKTDSLYSIEQNGTTLMLYELLLENYVLPPSNDIEDDNDNNIKPVRNNIIKDIPKTEDIYSFKVFDINAKCKFYKATAENILAKLDGNKITAIRGERNLEIRTSELVEYFKSKGQKVIQAVCTEESNYHPWGVLEQLFRDFYELPLCNSLIPENYDNKRFNELFNLLFSKPRKASAPEDARFAYMEDFGEFLAGLKNCVVIIEAFENMDDTSIQTLELFFDRFKKLNTNFVFITNSECALHSKIKGLLRTPLYSEYSLQKVSMETILSSLKEEAGDFIQSFYFEKIQEYFDGSLLYFDNALRYLTEKNILINFENRLLIKSNNSVILPKTLPELLKARLKYLGKQADASMILAYSTFLGARLDFETLKLLGIKEPEKAAKVLQDAGFAVLSEKAVYINNFNLIKPVIESSLKKEVTEFLCRNILAKLAKGLNDTLTLLIFGKLSYFKEEYLLLWRNSQFAMNSGDFDAYLKNCLGFLSLVEHIGSNIPAEDIENNKKEVYQNILMCLYSYSPDKIYSIENVLLMDALKDNDNERIVKLSNLMLQGALISSNYTDALTLLHNILTRMPNPKLIVDGAINTKFLLLSLVNIEILFNIGDFEQCTEVAAELLNVLRPEIIEKIKPASFSMNLFAEHLFETFRLAGFAKLFLMNDGLEEFFEQVKIAMGDNLPDKDCILAVRDFIRGNNYAISNIENSSAFSKVIYLILQEFNAHKSDYKVFAQNIYQAKLLASDIHQTQLELFCDLLIAYCYANIGIKQKAEAIYSDILQKAENSAIFNILILAKYFIAKLKIAAAETEEALLIINDALALLQKYNNQSKIIYVMFEKLFVDIVKEYNISAVNIESEEQKLAMITSDGRFARLIQDN